MYWQRSVRTVRQRLMSTAVTFADLTESWSAVTATCTVVASRLPGDSYHGHALWEPGWRRVRYPPVGVTVKPPARSPGARRSVVPTPSPTAPSRRRPG